jgi:tetratricopeptide (TPR) repeat protein
MRRAILLLAIPSLLAAQTPEQLFQARRFDEARAAFQALLAQNRNDANALFYMGRIAYAQDKDSEAANWFEKAVKQDDQSAVYHLWLGRALGDLAQNANKLKQPFLARRVRNEFERAVQLDPRMPEPREGLVDFYSIAPGVMGGSMDKAKEQAAELVKLNPMRGHLASARLAERQKDSTTAEREYKAAIAAASDSAAAYYTLASWYRRQSRWDEAFATYEQLMAAKPDEVTAHATWGIVAAISGKNLERGERELKYWLDNPPADAPAASYSNVHFRLGQIYEKTERKELARSEYSEALKANPQNQDAKKALAALR